MKKKLAVIDIGSNSVRLQISEIQESKRFRVTLEEKDTIRLGEEVFSKGFFGKESIEKAVTTMQKFKKIIDKQKVDYMRAVATAAFREASNRDELIHTLYQKTGIGIEVITGEEEAKLIARGVFSNYELNGKKALILDIGGGSAELIYGNLDKIFDVKSLSLGCTRLTRFFLKSNPVKTSEMELLGEHIDSLLDDFQNGNGKEQNPDLIIGTGGSLNNITEIIYKLNKKNTQVTHREVSLEEVQKLNRELEIRTLEKRLNLPGLEKKRFDIILAAGKVIEALMLRYQMKSFTSLGKGLRDGLTQDSIHKLGIVFPYQQENPQIKEQRVWEIGHKFFFEEKHAINVTEICMKLFDSLKGPLNLKEKWADYLKTAAILHDIGYYISYSKHHKHSQYLIENSEFVGYNAQEVKMIANIARYHRKALPKITHESFRELSLLEKDVVLKMASILRVGDALDRSHRESIHDFRLDFRGDTIAICVDTSEADLFMEREGLAKKSNLFTQTFKKKVRLEGCR